MRHFDIKRFFRVGLAVFALIVGLNGVALAAGTSWTLVPSPNPSPTANGLASVVAISANDVWAVGDMTISTGASNTLIEHWNGSTWNVVASPNPSASHNDLTGVAAVNTDDVWAVGRFNASGEIPRTLIQHWDGGLWNTVDSPNIGPNLNDLNGVAAISARDVWAVGQFSNRQGFLQTLVLHWNGQSWRPVVSPNVGTHNNVLTGVTAVAANDVWAVGDFLDNNGTFHPLIEHWNGTAWSVVPNASAMSMPGVLNAVKAIATNDVWAVGQVSTTPLIEHWDGTTWSVVPSPTTGSPNSTLLGIAAASANKIAAVGFNIVNGTTLIEQWDGTSWHIVPSPNPGPSLNLLNGAAADRSTGQVWAVGEFFDASGTSQTLTLLHP
jgi:hypothetical protein